MADKCAWKDCPKDGTEGDHFIPDEIGGNDTKVNITPLCPRHHKLKTDFWRKTATSHFLLEFNSLGLDWTFKKPKVDLILTSPPYCRSPFSVKKSHSGSDLAFPIPQFLKNCNSVLKDKGACFILIHSKDPELSQVKEKVECTIRDVRLLAWQGVGKPRAYSICGWGKEKGANKKIEEILDNQTNGPPTHELNMWQKIIHEYQHKLQDSTSRKRAVVLDPFAGRGMSYVRSHALWGKHTPLRESFVTLKAALDTGVCYVGYDIALGRYLKFSSELFGHLPLSTYIFTHTGTLSPEIRCFPDVKNVP